MKIATCFLILSLSLLLHPVFSQFTAPRFQRITIADGLPNGEVRQIKEDADGFIWFGTAEGFCRFDGYKNQLLIGRDSAMTVAINTDNTEYFDWDAQKRWWIASNWAGLRLYDPARQQFTYVFNNPLIKNEQHYEVIDTVPQTPTINGIFSDNANRIWIGMERGLQVFDIANRRLDKNPQLIPSFFKDCSVNQISKDAKGDIWAAVTKQGLCRFDSKTQTWSIEVKHLDVRSFSFDREGDIFWISDKRLYHYQPKSNAQTEPFRANLNSLSVKPDFLKIHIDQRKRVWIGTANGLILLKGNNIPPQVFKHDPHNPNSLLSDYTGLIYEDSKGNIWVSCGVDGVCMIPNSFERIKVFENKTMTHRINDIATAPDSTLYASTQTHLIVSRAPYYRTEYLPFTQLIPCPNLTTTHIVVGKNGKVYLGTECGIWAFLPNEKRCSLILDPKFEGKDLYGLGFGSFHIWGDSILTFSRYSQLGMHVFNLKTKKYQLLNSTKLNHNIIFTEGMVRDKKGVFWANSFKGLIKMGNFLNRLDTFSAGTLDAKNYQTNTTSGNPLIQIGDDLWWGRFDKGGLSVLSLRDSAYGSFKKTNGLFDNFIQTIVLDKFNHLWLGSHLGVCHFPLPKDFRITQQVNAQNFSTADGLPHNTIVCSTTTPLGDKVFMGTVGGLAMINTEGAASDTISPKLVFSNLAILNKVVRPNDSTGLLKTDINQTQNLTLQPNQAFFTLEVSGLNFVNPHLTRYAYRLSGLQGDWIDNGFSNILSFNNMASGNYVLEVKALASNGLWSAVKIMKINVLYPIWQRWWFICLSLLVATGGIYAFYQFRIQQIERMQTLQNNIAADLHDDVGAALTNIEILSFLTKNQINDSEKVENLIDKIGEEAKKTNESLHQLVWTMKTENDGLEQTLAQLNRMAVDNLEIQNIRFSVMQTNQNLQNYHLSSEKRRDLIMVFKETLANITKHAQATEVHLSIDIQKQVLLIVITDNGVGILKKDETPKSNGGNGLKNMQTRLMRHGGQIAVHNRQGEKGVLVEIRLPI